MSMQIIVIDYFGVGVVGKNIILWVKIKFNLRINFLNPWVQFLIIEFF